MSFIHQVDHRPWPKPRSPWLWRQDWQTLCFAHWVVDKDILSKQVPNPLELDLFQGQAYVSVVPFIMTGVRPRWLPSVPWLSRFPELNLRTYVKCKDQAGVWFLSLEAPRRAAVWAAQHWFHLPYWHAHIDTIAVEDVVHYQSTRVGSPEIGFQAQYQPTGLVDFAQPGTLDHWLTERYALFANHPTRGMMISEVHHAPWPLQPATIQIHQNSLGEPFGLDLSCDPPHIHYSQNLPVVMWPLTPL